MSDYENAGALIAAALLIGILSFIFAVATYVLSSWFLMRIFDKAGVQGKWRAWGVGYFPATKSIYLSGTGFKGYKLRVRAAYVKGSSKSGDSLNTTTWTSYQYLYFTK